MSEPFKTAEQNRAALIMHRVHGYVMGAVSAFIFGLLFGIWLFWTRAQMIGAAEYLFAGALKSLGMLDFLAARSPYFYQLAAWYSSLSPESWGYILHAMIYPAIMGICFAVIAVTIRSMIIQHLKALNQGKPAELDKVEKLR